MRCFQNGVIGQVEQTKDDDQYDWNHNHQSLSGALLVFVLTTPIHVIAGRQLHLARELRLGLVNEATYVATAHIEQNCAPKESILAGDDRWGFDGANLRQLGQWDGSA